MITTSILSLALAIAMGSRTLFNARVFSGLIHDSEAAWTMITLVVISSVLALHLMNTFQPRVSPAIASVIYCTEPLFSTIFSLLFATEKLAGSTVLGGVAVTASVLVVASMSTPKSQDAG